MAEACFMSCSVTKAYLCNLDWGDCPCCAANAGPSKKALPPTKRVVAPHPCLTYSLTGCCTHFPARRSSCRTSPEQSVRQDRQACWHCTAYCPAAAAACHSKYQSRITCTVCRATKWCSVWRTCSLTGSDILARVGRLVVLEGRKKVEICSRS